MGNNSSNSGASETTQSSLSLPLPIRDGGLFKHRASPHVLNFLADNPALDVSIRQLASVTPVSERATREAVAVLEANDLIETFHEGNARRVHINRTRLSRADDPIQAIPQPAYRTPVRVASEYLQDELDELRGIVLFGSVARGTADRQSDIDLWVLVDGDLLARRNTVNRITKQLEAMAIPETLPLQSARDADFDALWPQIREELEEAVPRESAQRYAFELVVETPDSILAQASRVEPAALLGDGLTIYSTPTLERVRRELLGDD